MISEEAEREDVAELERLMLELGLTSTMAEENRKKSWILLSFAGENWDLAFTISSLDLKLLLYVIAELFNR